MRSHASEVRDQISIPTPCENSESKSLFVFGVVYKVHDPHDVYLDATGVVNEKCYEGKTELLPEERYKGHINQSKGLVHRSPTISKSEGRLFLSLNFSN